MNVVVSNWSANVVALAAYAVAAVTHLLGVRDAATDAGRQGRSLPPGQLRRAVAFQAGLLLAVLAVVSPIGYWSYRYIWVRNFQDVILTIAAPALIVLGAPWLPLRRGLGLAVRDRRAAGAPAAPGEPGGSDAAGQDWSPGWPALPIVVTVMFCVVWWVWHLPGPFDAAVRSPAVYALEMITYLAAGILMWLQLVESPPLRPQLPPLRRIALVLVLAASGTVLGLIRAYGPGVAYPAYLDVRPERRRRRLRPAGGRGDPVGDPADPAQHPGRGAGHPVAQRGGVGALSGRFRPFAQAQVSLAVPARSEMTVS